MGTMVVADNSFTCWKMHIFSLNNRDCLLCGAQKALMQEGLLCPLWLAVLSWVHYEKTDGRRLFLVPTDPYRTCLLCTFGLSHSYLQSSSWKWWGSFFFVCSPKALHWHCGSMEHMAASQTPLQMGYRILSGKTSCFISRSLTQTDSLKDSFSVLSHNLCVTSLKSHLNCKPQWLIRDCEGFWYQCKDIHEDILPLVIPPFLWSGWIQRGHFGW